MYKLLLAEDEYIERAAMKQIISMKYSDKYEIYEATNGIEAVEKASAILPDLIFLDIKMPGISGVEAAKKIRKSDKNVKIVFITAYDYFEYAQAAITVKAEDIILKPVEIDTILNFLEKCTKELDAEKKERIINNKINTVTRQFEIELISILQQFNCDVEDVEYYFDVLGIEFEYAKIVFIDFRTIDSFKSIGKMQREFIIERFVKKLNEISDAKNIRIIAGSSDEYIPLLFILNNNTVNIDIRHILNEAIDIIDLNIKYEVGRLIDNKDDLHSELFEIISRNNKKSDILVKYPFDLEQELLSAINKRDFDTARDSINKISDILSEEFFDNEYKILVVELYAVVKRCILRISPDAFLKPSSITIFNIKDRLAFDNIFLNILGYAEDYVKEHSDKNKLLIDKVCNYVNNHFNETVTVDDMANMIGYSTYYFMKLFKEYLGMSFVDYITNIRMEKAKHLLLTTDMTVSEICFYVGYNDPNYFTRIFKKIETLTPREYKKIQS